MYDYFILGLIFFLFLLVATQAVMPFKVYAAALALFFSLSLGCTILEERSSIQRYAARAAENIEAGRNVQQTYQTKLKYLVSLENTPAQDIPAISLGLLTFKFNAVDSAELLSELRKSAQAANPSIANLVAGVKSAGNSRLENYKEEFEYAERKFNAASGFHTRVVWPIFDFLGIKSALPRHVGAWSATTL